MHEDRDIVCRPNETGVPFLQTAHVAQLPPPADKGWRNWLFMGGRGAGKTRAGAEWLRFSILYGGVARACLAGPTLGDVREVMLEGKSGLIMLDEDESARPAFSSSRRRAEWPNGAITQAFSAEDADSFRGPQFDAAWCDELAAWRDHDRVWDTMQMAVRTGITPRVLATTTPRPTHLIRRLVQGEAIVTYATTLDNANYLAPDFIQHVERTYGGTTLSRQELGGELIEDLEGALWSRSMIEAHRTNLPPDRFENVIVAVDPPITSTEASDACGIVIAGTATSKGGARQCFVLGDESVQGLRPMEWAQRVVQAAYTSGASSIVAEANQGGEMISSILEMVGCPCPVQLVHARLGKQARATPVAALYQQGRVSHIGTFPELEDEMCRFGAPGFSGSPDRLDALVWAVTSLILAPMGEPRLRFL